VIRDLLTLMNYTFTINLTITMVKLYRHPDTD